ncbi:MAG: CoA transferase [Dehalococcoidales bacterium]|nr:CoA transferase [Dehalococcoidales bacterium]
MAEGALSGIKVVELATMVAGPYCGKLLADLGADVIKVEPPEGDPSRLCGPFPKGKPKQECSALFLYTNTSKRGITLDITSQDGLEVLKKLIKWADVLIDNHPPHYLDSLGLDWETIHKINQGLVFTVITPYGLTGPRAGVNGDELTLIHAAGLGNLMPTRSSNIDRAPVKMGGYSVGYSGGATAALATMGAVLGKMKSGSGQLIDISLQEAILNLMRSNVSGSRYEKVTWGRVPDRPPAMGRMKTSDGYVVVGAAGEDHHFKAMVELMGNPEWASAPEWIDRAYRTNHLPEIAAKMDEWMLHQEKDEIHHRAAKKGIPIGPINSVKDVLKDEQYAARKYFVEVEHPEAGKLKYAGWPYLMTATPPRVQCPAPLLGEHNQEVFCDVLGYSPGEFKRLAKSAAAVTGEKTDEK